MAPLFSPGNSHWHGRFVREHRRLVAAVLLLPAVLGLLGGGYLAQTRAHPAAPNSAVAPVAAAVPLAVLNTAAEYMARGDDDDDRGAYDQAIADYGRAIALKPDFAEAYNNRGYTYMLLQEYALALPDLDQAIRLRPTYVHALMNRGDIYNYYYHIDRSRALSDYDRVLAIDPNTPNLCGHRLLAAHNGWGVGVIGELLTHGGRSGCT